MENNHYNEKEYKSFGEILSTSFEVFKENFLTYFVAFMVIGLMSGAISGLQYIFPSNGLVQTIFSLINIIVGSVIAIIYVATTYNSLYPSKSQSLGDFISSKIWPMLLTQLLLVIIMFIPIFMIMLGVVFGLMSTGGYGAIMPVTMVLMIVVALLSIKFVFLPQSIVLSDQQYWSAIKWSWQKTSGHLGMIIGIVLTPAIIGIIAFLMMRAGLMNLIVNIIFSIASAIIAVIVTLALSVLYIDVVLDEESDHEEILIYGGDH